MSSSRVAFAKGPSGPGFRRERSVVYEPPFELEYPVDKPCERREFREWLPGRPYYNMRLEEYPPYKALGEPYKLHGPEPYWPQLCGCSRYYVKTGMCVCSMSCMRKPLYAWAKANPEAFAAKQREMARWYRLAKMWHDEKNALGYQWDAHSRGERMAFLELQDAESPMGCASCERWGSSYCKCECEGCGSKYCPGCGYDDDHDEGW